MLLSTIKPDTMGP